MIDFVIPLKKYKYLMMELICILVNSIKFS